MTNQQNQFNQGNLLLFLEQNKAMAITHQEYKGICKKCKSISIINNYCLFCKKLICLKCFNSIKNEEGLVCGICEKSYLVRQDKHKDFKEFTRFSCCFTKQGCSSLMKSKNILLHQKKCIYQSKIKSFMKGLKFFKRQLRKHKYSYPLFNISESSRKELMSILIILKQKIFFNSLSIKCYLELNIHSTFSFILKSLGNLIGVIEISKEDSFTKNKIETFFDIIRQLKMTVSICFYKCQFNNIGFYNELFNIPHFIHSISIISPIIQNKEIVNLLIENSKKIPINSLSIGVSSYDNKNPLHETLLIELMNSKRVKYLGLGAQTSLLSSHLEIVESFSNNASLKYLTLVSFIFEHKKVNQVLNSLSNVMNLVELRIIQLDLSEKMSSIFANVIQSELKPRLKLLHLGYNNIQAKGMNKISDALKTSTISNLKVIHNDLSGNDLNMFESLKYNRFIEKLNISYCSLPEVCSKALGVFIANNKYLSSLTIKGNIISSKFLEGINFGLKHTQSLKDFNLSSSNLGKELFPSFCKGLKSNNSLCCLNLSAISINSDHAKLFADYLKFNLSLQELKLNGNNIDDSGIISLSKALYARSTNFKLIIDFKLIEKKGKKEIKYLKSKNSLIQIVEPNKAKNEKRRNQRRRFWRGWE